MDFLFEFLLWCFAISFGVTIVASENPPMENPDLFSGDILGIETGQDRSAIVDQTRLWPGGVVPFVQDPGLKETVHYLFLVERAMGHYHRSTCIRFVPRTNETDYIRLFPGQGCYSHVGRTGGMQPVSLGRGCGYEGTITHELGHVVGFYHEQNRSDRDEWLIIYWENIRTGEEDQFFKLTPQQNQLLTSFDYDSILLYGSYTFSKDSKKLRTMEGKGNKYLKDVNSKNRLSSNDIKRIKMLYNCK